MKRERVIFRRFKKEGDLIAFLPDSPANNGFVMSYQHIGQHGEANYNGLLAVTTLANSTDDDVTKLHAELETIGYKLNIRERINRKD